MTDGWTDASKDVKIMVTTDAGTILGWALSILRGKCVEIRLKLVIYLAGPLDKAPT